MEDNNNEIINLEKIEHLKALKQNPAWLLIRDNIQNNIDLYQAKLNGEIEDDEEDDLNEIKLLRNSIKLCKGFISTPDVLMKELEPDNDTAPDKDVYD